MEKVFSEFSMANLTKEKEDYDIKNILFWIEIHDDIYEYLLFNAVSNYQIIIQKNQ